MDEGCNYCFLGSIDQDIDLYIAYIFVFNKENVTITVIRIKQDKYIEKQPSSEYIAKVFKRLSRNDFYNLFLNAIRIL